MSNFNISTENSIIKASANGIETTNRESILEYLLAQFKAVYGANTEIGVGTEDYNALSLFSDLLSDMGNVATTVANGYSLTTATGFQLDNIASIFYGNISREKGTASTVQVVLTGTATTELQRGSKIKDTFGGIWNLPDTTLRFDTNGKIETTATYSVVGPYNVANEQISGSGAIATPQANWTDVAVKTGTTVKVGTSQETDTEFRLRLMDAQQLGSMSTLQSLRGNLLSLTADGENYVRKVTIYENNTNSPKTVGPTGNTVTVNAHSIYTVVQGDIDTGDTEKLQSIADALYLHKGQGVGTDGSLIVDVSTSALGDTELVPSTADVEVKFSLATAKALPLTVTLQKTATSSTITELSALKDELQPIIESVLSRCAIGSVVFASSIQKEITAYIDTNYKDTLSVVSITVSSGATYELGATEYATRGSWTLSIN